MSPLSLASNNEAALRPRSTTGWRITSSTSISRPRSIPLLRDSWIPHHGFWTARFYTGKVWIIGIDENIHFPALKRQARHEEDRRASLVKLLIAKPPAGRQIVRGPTFQFGTCDSLRRDTFRYGDFDTSLGSGDDSKIGMHENFQQSPSVGLSRINGSLPC